MWEKEKNAGYQIESTCIQKKDMQLKNINLFLKGWLQVTEIG